MPTSKPLLAATLLVLLIVSLTAVTPSPLLANTTLTRGTPYLVAAGRTPIPMQGENLTSPLPFKRLVDETGDKVVADAPAPGEVIAWGAAHNYVGQVITVEGTIVDTYNHRGNVVFLNFSKDWRGKFYIPVFKTAFENMSRAPESYFLNKKIQVTGKVTLHNNRPNIEVEQISQIKVVR
jgi:hypothetical protein